MVCGEEVRYGPKRSAKGTKDEWCWPWHDGTHSFSKSHQWFSFELFDYAPKEFTNVVVSRYDIITREVFETAGHDIFKQQLKKGAWDCVFFKSYVFL